MVSKDYETAACKCGKTPGERVIRLQPIILNGDGAYLQGYKDFAPSEIKPKLEFVKHI